MYDEIKASAQRELDYLEADAAARLRECLNKSRVFVPLVRSDLSSAGVSDRMGRWRQPQSTNNRPVVTHQRDSISSRLLDSFLRQLLDERFFHADPHAGNILINHLEKEQPDLWLLDYV